MLFVKKRLCTGNLSPACKIFIERPASDIAFDKEHDPLVKYSACVVVEAIYFLHNLNVTLPYSFLSNLIQSLISGSKTVTRVNSKVIPSGSYPTIQSWLEEKGKEPLESPSGDINTFFDNIRKYIIKNYHVWSKKNKTADIILTILHIALNTENNLQSDKDLKPSNWCKNLLELAIQQKMKDFIEKCKCDFRVY